MSEMQDAYCLLTDEQSTRTELFTLYICKTTESRICAIDQENIFKMLLHEQLRNVVRAFKDASKPLVNF